MADTVERQRFFILGQVYAAGDGALQQVLSRVYGGAQRPRCLCREAGVEMYVAQHNRFVIKRMPDTGNLHHPGCPSYEPEASKSGLGELVGTAVLEPEPGRIELRVDFPWSRSSGVGHHSMEARSDAGEVSTSRRRMSLRAVMHYLFERAGFNRWTPSMAGKRSQRVVQKYLTDAAIGISIKGVDLVDRLYVPEAFSEASKMDVARRRREKLSVLRRTTDAQPLALILGEFKKAEKLGADTRLWIKHMPDTPLWVEHKTWGRLQRTFLPVFETVDGDSGLRTRPIMVALVRARSEFAYEIDVASLMLVTEHWIPIEGAHELPLIDALVRQGRRFIKPLRYDARMAGAFANALLLDTGAGPTPLHVVSPFLAEKEQLAKREALSSATVWAWHTGEPMPQFPVAHPVRASPPGKYPGLAAGQEQSSLDVTNHRA